MVSAILSRLVILVFGTLYPAYASYKAVRTKNVKEYVKWMMYWIVFALFCSVETFSDVFLSWLPFYYELKIVFVLWMLSPMTQGSSFLFKKFVHPHLARREKEIDEMIEQASKQGYSTLLTLGTKGLQAVMKTAIMGQSKLVDHLRRSYSTSDLSDDGQNLVKRHEALDNQEEEEEDELDNRLREDNAELEKRSRLQVVKSKSTSSAALSLSSVKEEEGEDGEHVITETFTIPATTSKRHYSMKEGIMSAKRQLRSQSLPPSQNFPKNVAGPKHQQVIKVETIGARVPSVIKSQQFDTVRLNSPENKNFQPKVMVRSLSHDSPAQDSTKSHPRKSVLIRSLSQDSTGSLRPENLSSLLSSATLEATKIHLSTALAVGSEIKIPTNKEARLSNTSAATMKIGQKKTDCYVIQQIVDTVEEEKKMMSSSASNMKNTSVEHNLQGHRHDQEIYQENVELIKKSSKVEEEQKVLKKEKMEQNITASNENVEQKVQIKERKTLSQETEEMKTSSDKNEEMKTSSDKNEQMKTSSDKNEQMKTSDKNEQLKTTSDKNKQTKTSSDKTEQMKTSSDKTEQMKTSSDKTEPKKTSSDKTEQMKTSSDKTEQMKTSSNKTEPIKTSSDKTEQMKTSSDKTEQMKTSSDKTEQMKTSSDKTEQMKTSSDKTEQMKTSSDKTEQMKTSSGRSEPMKTTTYESKEHIEKLDIINIDTEEQNINDEHIEEPVAQNIQSQLPSILETEPIQGPKILEEEHIEKHNKESEQSRKETICPTDTPGEEEELSNYTLQNKDDFDNLIYIDTIIELEAPVVETPQHDPLSQVPTAARLVIEDKESKDPTQENLTEHFGKKSKISHTHFPSDDTDSDNETDDYWETFSQASSGSLLHYINEDIELDTSPRPWSAPNSPAILTKHHESHSRSTPVISQRRDEFSQIMARLRRELSVPPLKRSLSISEGSELPSHLWKRSLKSKEDKSNVDPFRTWHTMSWASPSQINQSLSSSSDKEGARPKNLPVHIFNPVGGSRPRSLSLSSQGVDTSTNVFKKDHPS
uniref:Receptor expression-enhancing protein n=1 Tax=Biomphalaria glabrata TaxID=6526 RepID=A0A2C9LR98_BIOGL